MSALVHDFIEESVWDRTDQRRPVRQPVRFRLVTQGKIDGKRLDESFVSDFGLFYDPEDNQLIDCLCQLRCCDDLVWSRYIYWKQHDRGQITIIDPLNDAEVGRIVVQRRLGGDPSGETDWTNVVSMVR